MREMLDVSNELLAITKKETIISEKLQKIYTITLQTSMVTSQNVFADGRRNKIRCEKPICMSINNNARRHRLVCQ